MTNRQKGNLLYLIGFVVISAVTLINEYVVDISEGIHGLALLASVGIAALGVKFKKKDDPDESHYRKLRF